MSNYREQWELTARNSVQLILDINITDSIDALYIHLYTYSMNDCIVL